MFARAGQPELVRSNQKDVYYLGFLREGIGQIYRNFRGLHLYVDVISPLLDSEENLLTCELFFAEN